MSETSAPIRYACLLLVMSLHFFFVMDRLSDLESTYTEVCEARDD